MYHHAIHPATRRAAVLLATTLLLMTSLVGTAAPRPAQAWDNGVADTPPMGWNSYDSYNWSVTEATVKANADYMRDNLRQYGWQYIVVDWAWYYPGQRQRQPQPERQPATPAPDGRQRPAAARHHPVPVGHRHQRVQTPGRLRARRRG